MEGKLLRTKHKLAEKITVTFPQEVACAILGVKGKILITRRRPGGHFGGYWEFPGGKRIASESLVCCLKRELFEELGVWVKPVRFLKRIDYSYPEKRVSLYFYECELLAGRPFPRSVSELKWVWPFETPLYSFPPADEPFLKELRQLVGALSTPCL